MSLNYYTGPPTKHQKRTGVTLPETKIKTKKKEKKFELSVFGIWCLDI